MGTKAAMIQAGKKLSMRENWRSLRDLNPCLLRERDKAAFSGHFSKPLKARLFCDLSSDNRHFSHESTFSQFATISGKNVAWAPFGHQNSSSISSLKRGSIIRIPSLILSHRQSILRKFQHWSGGTVATKLTETDKWNDDWFLDLEPKMKCAWEYLRDNCHGVGELKISFKKMSREIRADIGREEFNQNFKDRIVWLGRDELWIPGIILRQHRKFSIKNKVHVNIAKKVLRITENTEMNKKGAEVRQLLIDFLSLLDDRTESIRGPDEVHTDAKGTRNKDKGIRIKEKGKVATGGVGENREFVHPARAHATSFKYNFDAVRSAYPRPIENWGRAKVILAGIFSTDGNYERFLVAVEKYRTHCEVENIKVKFRKGIESFCEAWEFWESPPAEMSSADEDNALAKWAKKNGVPA